ncbi:hypothetical protein [uncultured Paracoccus sp.]|uniref:hypothetical protein n=1 Tax=uncultured Paracoccus sp. TaxID=189685 RepID=UPI002609EDB5|nr:hypothetical protein [uncultured Paracoccus sp.]
MIRCHQAPFGGLAGFLPIGVMLSMIGLEYTGSDSLALLTGILALLTVAAFVPQAKASRLAFVAVGLALVLWAAASRPDWVQVTMTAAQRGAMVIALFTALSAIRSAAMGSAEILDCGRFLARQPPGLRYVALTIGGHLFALILLYGSISLLGSLVTENAAREPDAVLRRHRIRRMMVAIQRGFASTLCWSPLGFSMAITISIVPGASWPDVVIPCIVSAVLMMTVGWALDMIFKPRLATPPPTRSPETGRWLVQLRPLLLLLGVVMSGVLILHLWTGVEVIGAVMSLVPAIAVLWIGLQPRPHGMGRSAWIGSQVLQFITRDIPGYRGEIVLLFMAGFIGSLGSILLVPVVQNQGVDLNALPPLLIMVATVWLVPLTGQLGMNPILAVSLLVPLLPSPQAMGISPVALVAAITGGWALSGATSPFTASVLISASLGGVTAREAGIGWNGLYTLVMGSILSAWVLILALIL